MLVRRSRIRITLPSECDSREYVDDVYKASVPLSFGTAGERRGVDMKALCLLSELRLDTGRTRVEINYYAVNLFIFRIVIMPIFYASNYWKVKQEKNDEMKRTSVLVST